MSVTPNSAAPNGLPSVALVPRPDSQIHILTGDTRSRANVAKLQELRCGRMFVETRPTPFEFERWGFDNGAFSAWINRRPWDGDSYLRRLEAALTYTSDPYLAVVPDLPAQCGSLEFSLSWLQKLPRWPWYLAVQDGMPVNEVRDVIHLFAGLFLGGSDKFKSSGYHWCRLAHAAGKKFHYARAGTPRKLISAIRCGADSCDSAFPLWSLERFQAFSRQASNAYLQMEMHEERTA